MRIYRKDNVTEFAFDGYARCESCANEQYIQGWDDKDYYEDHLPDLKCEACGKTRRDYEREKE